MSVSPAAVRVIVTFCKGTICLLLIRLLSDARIISVDSAWRLHHILFFSARRNFPHVIVERVSLSCGKLFNEASAIRRICPVHPAQYVPSAAVLICNHAFFTAGIFNPRLSQIGIDFTLVVRRTVALLFEALKMIRVLSGRQSPGQNCRSPVNKSFLLC